MPGLVYVALAGFTGSFIARRQGKWRTQNTSPKNVRKRDKEEVRKASEGEQAP